MYLLTAQNSTALQQTPDYRALENYQEEKQKAVYIKNNLRTVTVCACGSKDLMPCSHSVAEIVLKRVIFWEIKRYFFL